MTSIVFCCISRKLKNRVAAQTARDRKKARMETLEEQLARVEAENKRLIKENQQLMFRTSALSSENSQLREKLGCKPSRGVAVKKEIGSPVESAALNNVSPQQEQIRTLCQLTTTCMAYLMATRYVSAGQRGLFTFEFVEKIS